ncbi:MAG TPA: hypothetical protein PLI09_27200 [Candidatus Hydrogenedentes bacterium]|nr:hypothetical protein [Candidatus Hydrogenedentota bacterium]
MPQPIDPNTELARVTAVERIQQAVDRASLAAQARSASDAAQQQVNVESQVGQTTAKNERVDEELRRKNPFMGQRRRKEDEAQEESEESSPDRKAAAERHRLAEGEDSHHLDVIV